MTLGMKDLWTSFELLVDFHKTWQRGDVIQGDFDVMIFNPIASTILKWLRFEFVR
jgi:membrane-anchored glycerophosphoryl diester phosphodiesterase (GDPDase)